MLTTPDNLFFLPLLRDDLQNELFHRLSLDGGEVDWPVVPWVLLPALFIDWNDTGFPLVLGHLSCPPGPFKDDGEWLSNDIHQLPQHSWVHPIENHGFMAVQFASMISKPILLNQAKVFFLQTFSLTSRDQGPLHTCKKEDQFNE